MEKGTVGKDLVLEHVSVAGILYVTLDKELLYAHKFTEHVKIKIVFDDKVKVKREKIEEPCTEKLDMNVGLRSKMSVDFSEGEEEGKVDSGDELPTDNSLGVNQNRKSRNLNDIPKTRASSVLQAIRERGRELQRQSKLRVRQMDNNRPSHSHTSNSKVRLTSYAKAKSHVSAKSFVGELHDTRLPVPPDKTQKETNSSGKVVSEEKKKRLVNVRLDRREDICCSYCSQTFKSNREFRAHRKVEIKSYPCLKCHKVLQFKAHLMIHMDNCHGTELSDNSSGNKLDCGGSVSEKCADLESGTSGKKSKRMKCCVCGIMMSNLANLKLHVMVHTGEFTFKCCVCGQLSRTIGPHKKHMATHFKFGRVECKICKITFSNRSELSRHQLSHTFTCNLCGQEFPNKTGRYFHYRIFHKNDILKCPKCGRLYSCKNALDAHLKYHRNRRKTQCTVCGLFVFRLEKHMLSHTKPDDPMASSNMFICDKCPKQFKHKQAFQRHVSIHTEEKPYSCTECSKQFARSGGLSRHLRTHIPDKPYVCEICGKACKQLGNLKIHMQTHAHNNSHEDSNSLTCKHCGSTFAQKKALENHITTMHFLQMSVLNATEQFFPTDSSAFHMFT